jgi:hypothetical protein
MFRFQPNGLSLAIALSFPFAAQAAEPDAVVALTTPAAPPAPREPAKTQTLAPIIVTDTPSLSAALAGCAADGEAKAAGGDATECSNSTR